MDQVKTGKLISKKRKERGLTQEQLAERLGVSNKTISKWENGRCMPDYSVIKLLCDELKITVPELINGEEDAEKSTSELNDEQLIELIERTQDLEKQKTSLYGIILIVMGIALTALSNTIGGSNIKDFISGMLLGISIAEMLVGVYVVGRCFAKK